MASQEGTKIRSITSALDRFHRNLADIPDKIARELVEHWQSMRPPHLSATPGVDTSALAIGLEQRLWDLTISVAAFAPDHRAFGARALLDAIETEYPAFLKDWQARLDRIMERGKIRNESDYSLVRAAMDMAEKDTVEPALLEKMNGMLEAFEIREGAPRQR